MKTTFTLTAGAVLLLAACHSTKTDTWQKVVSAPHAKSDDKDRSRAYAAELHATLLRAGIAHKVVCKRRLKSAAGGTEWCGG